MTLLKISTLCLFLLGCTQTVIFRDGKVACIIQGDATNVTFRSGDVYFHADVLTHSAATATAYSGATAAIGGIGAGVASGLLARP